MRNIKKDSIPVYWCNLLKKHPHLTFKELEPDFIEEKVQLKSDMLKNEQCYLCCYCCKQIEENTSHIEHIKPRDSYPKLSMDYNNLLISCNDKKTCGRKKDNDILPESLCYTDWENRFSYTPY